MSTVGTLIVRLNAVTSQFRREMTEAQAKLQKTARVAEDASQTIATALATVGVGAAMAGGAAIKMAAQWEQTEIAFETMLKSGEKARSFLAELENFVDKTPFEMPGIISSTRRLMAFGFEAEEIIPMLTAVGNATAALGGGDFEIYRMTYALGQMRAKGHLAAEEMSRQLGQIIPAWEFLAESIGVSVGEAKKMVEQGMIPATEGIQAILQGMTREYGDAMGRQNRTLIGQWSTLKDRMRTIVRGMGAYFIDTLDIMPILQRLNRTFEGLATSLRGVENPAEAMRAILQQAFTPERRLIVVGLAGAISGLLYPALAAAATAAWKAAIALAPFVVKGAVLAIVIYNLYDALTRSTSMMDKAAAVTVALGVAAWFAYSSGLVALVKGLWAATTAKWAMIAAAKTLWGKIVALYALMGPKGWLMIAGAIGVTVAAVSILNRALAQTTAILAGAPQMQDYAGGATEGQKALTEAMEESTKAARRNILSFDQVHTLQEEMGKGGSTLPTLPDFASTWGGGTTRAVADMATHIDTLTKSIEGTALAMDASGGASEWLIGVWNGIKTAAANVAGAVVREYDYAKNRLSTIWGDLKTGAETSWNGITNAIAMAIDNARIEIGTRWDEIISRLRARWTAIQGAASIDWEAINENIRLKVLDLSGWLGRRWAAIQSALGTVWTAIQGAASEQWATIRDNVVTRVNEIIGAINNLIAAYNRIPLAPNLPMVGTIFTGASAPAGGGMGGLRTAERSTANQALINQLQADIARVSAGVGNPATEAWFARQHGGIQHYLDSQREKLQAAQLTPFAKGGIVTSPTRALIGEAGPEAVIPLRRGNAGIDAIADAVGNAVLYAMREAMRATAAGQGDSREIVLEVDGARLGRVILPALRNEGYRTGVVAT